MKLWLERLEDRTAPASFRPHFPVWDGTQATDVVQGRAADCGILATIATAAHQGVDLASRLHEVRLYVWLVQMYRPNGEIVNVPVRFDGRTTPLDPQMKHGEFWVILFARANRKLTPGVAVYGQTLESADMALLGRLPTHDDSPARVGLQVIKEALANGDLVVICSDAHAWGLLRPGIIYNPWGFVQRLSMAQLLRRPLELVILKVSHD